MRRPFDLLEQLADVVEAKTWSQPSERAGLDDEARTLPPRFAAVVDGEPQELIHDLFERSPGSPDFGFQLGGDVVVEGECGSHISMLKGEAS